MTARDGDERGAGALVPIPPAPRVAAPTLRELAPKFLLWFKFVRERADLTVENYGWDLRTFLAFCDRAGLTWPGQVTFREIEMYQAWLRQERGLKPRTANRHLHCLRSFWKWLTREGVTLTNPAVDVDPLKTPGRVPRRLPIYEQEYVLAELAKDTTLLGRRDYVLIATDLFMGLRCSELGRIRVDDVDLVAGTFQVVGKGNKQRTGDIIPRLGRILRDYLETVRPALSVVRPRGHLRRSHGRAGNVWIAEIKHRGEIIRFTTQTADRVRARAVLAKRLAGLDVTQRSPYLFLRAHRRGSRFTAMADRPLDPRSIYQIIRRRFAKILNRPVNPHMLRHSMGSRMRENDAPIELIKEALGHVDIRTTMIYAGLSSKKRKADIAKYLEGPGPEGGDQAPGRAEARGGVGADNGGPVPTVVQDPIEEPREVPGAARAVLRAERRARRPLGSPPSRLRPGPEGA
jgi:site-specific recombinase XerD